MKPRRLMTREEKMKQVCYCGAPADYGYTDYFEGYEVDTYYCKNHYHEYHHNPILGKMQDVDHITCKEEWKVKRCPECNEPTVMIDGVRNCLLCKKVFT